MPNSFEPYVVVYHILFEFGDAISSFGLPFHVFGVGLYLFQSIHKSLGYIVYAVVVVIVAAFGERYGHHGNGDSTRKKSFGLFHRIVV